MISRNTFVTFRSLLASRSLDHVSTGNVLGQLVNLFHIYRTVDYWTVIPTAASSYTSNRYTCAVGMKIVRDGTVVCVL